jgi:hypothetical protein
MRKAWPASFSEVVFGDGLLDRGRRLARLLLRRHPELAAELGIYDREKKMRQGRCRVTMKGWKGEVASKVYWLDQKTGQFQVAIEP